MAATAESEDRSPGTAGRNDSCPCGSGKKRKLCHPEAPVGAGPPQTTLASLGSGRLRQLVAYGRKTYDIRTLLHGLRDGRKQPEIPTSSVGAAVFFCGLLRIRSFNALEPKLSEKPFLNLVGAPATQMGSVDTLVRALRAMDLGTTRSINQAMLAKAERNKAFREGWVGALRYVAIDGWEPISSFARHCDECLVRKVKVKSRDGELVEVEQYYHRFAVAMMIDDRLDLFLDFEPLLPFDLRPVGAAKDDEDEGELTAAKRLLRRVKQTFPWLDVVIADGLYANGPFLSLAADLKMGAVVIARKEGDEPLREALALMAGQPPQVVVDEKKREQLELWDCPELTTLSSYQGPIRVVRARVTRLDEPQESPKTWCFLVTGKATKLAPVQVLTVGRGRWHIENTGFHQWTTHWKFDHVFTHDARAIQALYWLFFAAFNLLTFFLYRQLRCYGRDRGGDVTQTISRLVDEMCDDLARLDSSPWDSA